MTTETTFGVWLRQQRRRLDWTQVELAQRVGYSVATIRKLERDELRPSKRLAELLAHALEVAITQHASLVSFARATPTPPLEPDAQPLHEHRRSNLPAQLTPFFGRTAEIVELTQYLTDPATRLITIVGPGGMGKTRLALEVAQSILSLSTQTDSIDNLKLVLAGSKIVNRKFSDGVYFVALAPLRAPEHIVPAIAEAITLRFQAGNRLPKAQLLDYLRHKELLLVLDNFEHLVAGTELILELLQECPALRLLVTSRERLQLNSETLFVLESMTLPPTATLPNLLSYSAVQLFVGTACRLRSTFTPTAANAPAILHICQLVGAMPLGIILAAAWVEVLSPDEIVIELSRSFDFLAAELRDLPERQRSMRAVLTQSWQRLTDAERAVFIRLAVFRGGFTRSAAQRVAGASLRMINSFVNKSLVQYEPSGRYTIHELLRQYAEQQLEITTTSTQVREDHAVHYLDLAEVLASSLLDQQQMEWLQRLDADLDNLRAAFQWFLSHQPVQAVALVGALKNFWVLRSHYQEGRQWLSQALAYQDAPVALRARAMLFAGDLTNRQGESVMGLALVAESIRLYRELGDTQNLADALRVCGWVYDELQQRQPKIDAFEESLFLFRQIGDSTKIAILRVSLVYAYGAQQMGYAQANQELQESITLLRTGGNIDALLFALNMQGDVAIQWGDYSAAARIYDEMLVVADKADLQRQVAWAWLRLSECNRQLNNIPSAVSNAHAGLQLSQALGDKDALLGAWRTIGDAHRCNREYVLAASGYDQALTLCLEPNNRYQSLHCWIGCASIALANQHPENSVQLLGAAQKAVEELPSFLALRDRAELIELVAHARGELGEEIFDIAWRTGQAWSFEQGVFAAQALCRQVSRAEN